MQVFRHGLPSVSHSFNSLCCPLAIVDPHEGNCCILIRPGPAQGGKVGDSGFWGQLFSTLVSGKFLLSCWVGILLLFSPCSLSVTVTAEEDKGRLLTHLGPLLGLSTAAPHPPFPPPSPPAALGGSGGRWRRWYLSLPEIWEAESCHLPIWPEWGGQRIECRFPTRLRHPDQQGREGDAGSGV